MNTTSTTLNIAIGADHAGYELKEALKKAFSQINFIDKGTYSTESVDYPDYAHPVAQEVAQGNVPLGILICGSGEGVCITANKHQNVRAALCWNIEVSQLARQHNNANIICLPARFIDLATATAMVQAFLDTPFEGGRHEKRVQKISCN